MKQKHCLKKDGNKRDMQCECGKKKKNTANQPTEVHTIPTINDTARRQLLERKKQEVEECKVDIMMMMMILVRVVGVAVLLLLPFLLLETCCWKLDAPRAWDSRICCQRCSRYFESRIPESLGLILFSRGFAKKYRPHDVILVTEGT